MKRWIILAILASFPGVLQAQTVVTGWLSSQHNSGGDPFTASDRTATVEFDTGSGYGVSISRTFAHRWAGELSVFRLSSEGQLRTGNLTVVDLGDVELTPVMAMLQFHLRPDAPFDIYIGAGAAYVLTGDLDSDDLRADGLAPLELDDVTTAVVGAGLAWTFKGRWGLAVDARYLPLTLRGRAQGQQADAGMDPLIVSAGLRVRF
jgi:outer membrane protein W